MDPLVSKGDKIFVKWPMEDGSVISQCAVVLKVKKCVDSRLKYKLLFDDGDIRMTRLNL